MAPDQINLLFSVHFTGVLLGMSILAYVYWLPRLQGLSKTRQVMICLSPQMFRLMALGLFHPTLTPGISMDFAVPTVLVDVLVSLLAMVSVLLLHHDKPAGLVFAGLTILLGALHMIVAGYFAPLYQFPGHLAAQWLVPVSLGPVMVISLVLSAWMLLQKEG